MRSVIIIPTNRESSFHKWLEVWSKELKGQHIIVVEDNPQKTFMLNQPGSIDHYSWAEIDAEMGQKSWIIPRRTDCVRSFGFYKAYQMKPDMIVTLDDDCLPDHENFLENHWKMLETPRPKNWFQHFQGIRVRGLPYGLEYQKVALNMGLWSNIPDLDAGTQIKYPAYRSARHEFNFPSPKSYFSPICGMNLAFRPEIVPAFYFLLMGRDYEFDRFGDIWAGTFLKKICDHLDLAISGGTPFIRHERASNPLVNLKKEKPGLAYNEIVWKDVSAMELQGTTFKECYISLAEQLPEYSPYWKKLKKAMIIWAELF